MQELMSLPSATPLYTFRVVRRFQGLKGLWWINRTFGRLQDRITHHPDKTGYAEAKQAFNITD
ncbi:hypothetical protein [Dickeya fangzhongdai]|uniref:hypothetical protein n=1 Tax=Dickeya fangzhongdai TaxID=1778540 RepID=UPI0026DF598F|nr:hypothetical protein [Dickeya fangzhongdai]WKV49985.1 hypothetical protein PL145_19105 [Dickeya fangzhongdai]